MNHSSKHRSRKNKNKRYTKKRSTYKHMRGGNTTPSFLKPQPMTATPLKYGASNPAEEAFLENQMMANNQQRINDGLPPKQMGGSSQSQGIVVPQSDAPLANEPGGTNETTAILNEIIAQQGANAVMDGCVGAGPSCSSENLWNGKGGKHHYKRNNKRKSKRKTKRNNKHKTKRNNKQSRKHKTKKYNKKH